MRKRPRVCVLTGDPRLPDLTKRDQRYNDEDFATFRAMRVEGLRGRLGDDLASLLLQKRRGFRRQRCVAVLAGSEDQFLAAFLEHEPGFVLGDRV
jgi:hypothetical protein